MTYSIVARDPVSGDLGVAVQSHWFSVGTVVTWAEAGVGAVATQAFAEPAYGPRGLSLMRQGIDAGRALNTLLEQDAASAGRQVAFVDASGRVAAHTGAGCIPDAGHVTGEAMSAQANMMRNDRVWPAMLEAYQRAPGGLADRMLAALEAAEEAGGDLRGRQSAALLVVRATSSADPWRDRLIDVRVDDSGEPLAELRRLLELHRGYAHMEAADVRLVAGDVEGALREYGFARELLGSNDEAAFWTAVLLADSGRADEARAVFGDIASREPGWAELLRRLPATGAGPWSLLRSGDAVVERLLEP